MYKYRVIYDMTEGGHHPISIEIEASSVKVSKDFIVFFDEHGEDNYVFHKKDVVSCKGIE